MPDPTNDIDALLDLLAAQSRFGFHSALTALVAERNELASRCKAHEDMLRDDLSKKQKQYDESSQTIDMLHDLLGWADDGEKRIVVSVIEERDALKQRVAELEAKPPASDLRVRLVCAALTGILAHEGRDREFDCVMDDAIWMSGKALAAMRKGDANA